VIDVNPLIIYCFVGVASSLVAFYTSRFFFRDEGARRGENAENDFSFLAPRKGKCNKIGFAPFAEGKSFCVVLINYSV
jgi:hypothetical protein